MSHSGETIRGFARSAFCTPHIWKDPADMHRRCAGTFLHHIEGEGRTATRFKARCTCPCHNPPQSGEKESEKE